MTRSGDRLNWNIYVHAHLKRHSVAAQWRQAQLQHLCSRPLETQVGLAMHVCHRVQRQQTGKLAVGKKPQTAAVTFTDHRLKEGASMINQCPLVIIGEIYA